MPLSPLLGAVIGDIVGSRFEGRYDGIKTTEFDMVHPRCRFTDDSVMTFAVADALLQGQPFGPMLHAYGRAYPGRGYGGNFRDWLASDDPQPYGSYGNGSAMRASPISWAYGSLAEVLEAAEASARPSHDHPEGIKGAQAVAAAGFLARTGASKAEISVYVTETFGYDLSQSIDAIRPGYSFDVSCQGSVPQAIRAFLDSHDYESALRLAISLDGDSDTLACMAGGIAGAFYREIPAELIAFAHEKLAPALWQLSEAFDQRFG